MARRSVLVEALAAAVPIAARAQDPRATAAHLAALEWLALADRGDAKASFAAASPHFRNAAQEEGWAKALATHRADLGDTVARTRVVTEFHPTLPGLPDNGDYIVINYRTSFAKRDAVRERVTLVRDADGVYRVAGYSIG